jgi:predicted dithiol-disulfide oxidoreductase (DUF899 family)
MPEHEIATREQWEAVRATLLAREKELTRMSDALARERQQLPWVPVEKAYMFQTADGQKTLGELFDGRSQLVVYSFMFGPDYEAGCPVCSSIADSFNGVIGHLEARDVTMICISQARIEKLVRFRDRMGWSFTWASSAESDFNADFGHSFARAEVSEMAGELPAFVSEFAAASGTDVAGYIAQQPGLTVFTRVDGTVYLAYTSTSRGLEVVMSYYGILDRVPLGRDEHEPAYQSWLRHRDMYGQTDATASAP